MAKAQVFFTDLLISIGIFSTAVVLFLALSTNLEPAENTFEVLVSDSNAIGDSLMSSGQPFNWNANNVIKIGLTDNYRLNTSKVQQLMNLSPVIATSLFGTSANYAVFFQDKHNNVLNFNGCVFTNADLTVSNITESYCENFTITPDNNLVSIERLIMHNFEIIKIEIRTWN